MNYKAFSILQKAVELYRKELHEETLRAIKRQNTVGSIYWKVFRKYSITGFGETISIAQVTDEELLEEISRYGVSKIDLNFHLKKAEELYEEWEQSQNKHSVRTPINSKGERI